MRLTLDLKIKRAGTLIASDALPILSDPTASFGVRRKDTSAVVVAAGTAMDATATTGIYVYSVDPVVANVTYEYWSLAIVGGIPYRTQKYITAPADIAADSYLSLDAADAMAAKLPGLAAYKVGDETARSAVLLLATIDVDRAMRYQGRKADPTQALEFPRVSYEFNLDLLFPNLHPIYPLPFTPSDAMNIALSQAFSDWDSVALSPVVPAGVKLATLFQADSLASGTRDGRLQAIADGLLSQATGSLAETYRVMTMPSVLCERAAGMMNYYRLRQGRLL